jgi:hypothetical protein
MGKKAKNASGLLKAAQRKVNKAALPPPPVPVEEEVRFEIRSNFSYDVYKIF